MNTRSAIQQNTLLISTINPTHFCGMTPLLKSPSESNGFTLKITDSMEDLSVIDTKKSVQEINLFNKLNIHGKDTNSNKIEGKGTRGDADGQQERDVTVKLLESPQAVVGIWSTINIRLLAAREQPVSIDNVSVSMVLEGTEGQTYIPCDVIEHDGAVTVKTLPLKVGPCMFVVTSQKDTFNEAKFTVEVYGNNPEISFSESGTDWPVTVAFKPTESCVYLAFNHHVSKFTQDGEFVKVILREQGAYINDIAVDPCRARLVLGVSGWKDVRGYKLRFQEVRLYSMTGTHMWTTGGNQPLLFGAPILHVAFNEEGNIIVAGHKCVDLCHKSTGNIEQKFNLEQVVTPSRVCATPDAGFAIAEATEGTVQIYDKCWKLKVKFLIVDLEGKRVHGVSGLAVDSSGNILVSSCEREEFFIYNSKGSLTSVIESDWDCPKWPLDLTASNDGYIFVADHGHACAKKYKYM